MKVRLRRISQFNPGRTPRLVEDSAYEVAVVAGEDLELVDAAFEGVAAAVGRVAGD